MPNHESRVLLPESNPPRRGFLGLTSRATLSAAALMLLGGHEALAQGMSGTTGDISILNTALGLEYEAIGAYQLGAQSGLLQKPVLQVAVYFQGQHKAHRDALIATIHKLGGMPVADKSLDEYATELQANTLKSQGDVLALATRLELGAANAYLGVIPSFKDPQLAKISGRIAADEVSHYTALLGAQRLPLPANALSFGA